MNAQAGRHRTERAARKETRRAVRWPRDIPEPAMAAARRLAEGLLGGRAAADPDGAARGG